MEHTPLTQLEADKVYRAIRNKLDEVYPLLSDPPKISFTLGDEDA